MVSVFLTSWVLALLVVIAKGEEASGSIQTDAFDPFDDSVLFGMEWLQTVSVDDESFRNLYEVAACL
jgi:hypothetical protein